MVDEAFQQIIIHMCEGNPGALTAIKAMLDADQNKAAMVMGFMEAANIRGQYIWILYKDLFDFDADKLLEYGMQDNGRKLARKLNRYPGKAGYKMP